MSSANAFSFLKSQPSRDLSTSRHARGPSASNGIGSNGRSASGSYTSRRTASSSHATLPVQGNPTSVNSLGNEAEGAPVQTVTADLGSNESSPVNGTHETSPQKPFVYSRSLMLSLWSKERTFDVPIELSSILNGDDSSDLARAQIITSKAHQPMGLQPFDADEEKLYNSGQSLNSDISLGNGSNDRERDRYSSMRNGAPNGHRSTPSSHADYVASTPGSAGIRSSARTGRNERSLGIQGGVLSGIGNASPSDQISPPFSRRHRGEPSISSALEENSATPTRYLNKKTSLVALGVDGSPNLNGPPSEVYKPQAHRADEANSWRRSDRDVAEKPNGLQQPHLHNSTSAVDSPPASWDSEEEEEPVRKGKLDLASNSLKASTGPSSSRRSSVAIDPKEPERLSLSTLLADEEDLPIAPSLSDLSLDPLSKNAMSLQEDPLLSRRVASNSSPVQLRSLASSISSGSPAPPPGLALRPVESEGPPENIQWVYTDPSGKVQGPFLGGQMHGWYSSGYFTGDLMVKKLRSSGAFESLDQLVNRLGDRTQPFLALEQRQTFTPQPFAHRPDDPARRSISGPWQQMQSQISTPGSAPSDFLQQQALNALLAQAQTSSQLPRHDSPLQQHSQLANARQFSNNYDPFTFAGASGSNPLSHVSSAPLSYHQPHGQPFSDQQHILARDPWGVPIQPQPIQQSAWQQQQPPQQQQQAYRQLNVNPNYNPALASSQPSYASPDQQTPLRQPSYSAFASSPNGDIPSQQVQPAWSAQPSQPVWNDTGSRPQALHQDSESESRPLLADLKEESTVQHQPIGTPAPSAPQSPSSKTAPLQEPTSVPESQTLPQPTSQSFQLAPVPAPSPAPSDTKPFTEVSHKTKQQTVLPATSTSVSAAATSKGKVNTISQAEFAKQQEQQKHSKNASQDTLASHLPTVSSTVKAAPWAASQVKDPSTSATQPGLSLREIQEKERKLEESRLAVEKKQRAAQAAQEQVEAAARLAAEQAESLPSASSWGAQKTSSPAPQPTLSRGWQKADAAGKKTLKEIQEEEARQKKAAAQKQAQAQAGATRGYANMAGTIAAKVNDGPWSVVGSKPAQVTTPPVAARPTATAGGPRSVPGVTMASAVKPVASTSQRSSTVNATKPVPAAVQAKPKATAPAVPDTPQPSTEFLAWTKTALHGLTVNIDEFIGMLLSFPVNPDSATMEIISDAVYANSSTLDGRRFAEQFALKRKADAGLSLKGKQPTVPPATPFARTAADALKALPKQPDSSIPFKQIKSKKRGGK